MKVKTEIVGNLDNVTREGGTVTVSDWLVDDRSPREKLRIVLADGQAVLAESSASFPRSDVERALAMSSTTPGFRVCAGASRPP